MFQGHFHGTEKRCGRSQALDDQSHRRGCGAQSAPGPTTRLLPSAASRLTPRMSGQPETAPGFQQTQRGSSWNFSDYNHQWVYFK